MTEYLPVFAAVALVNMLGWLTPGPNMLVVASAALSRGTRAGIVTGCGVAFGGLIWASLAVLGVGVVFETLPTLFTVLKVAGGLYLIWLGVKAWRRPSAAMAVRPGAAGSGFWTGVAVNLTNPKAILFHGAVLAAVVPSQAPVWFLLVILAFSQTQAALQHGLTAVLFGTRTAGRVFGAMGQWTNRLFGVIFAGLGAGLLWQALRRPA